MLLKLRKDLVSCSLIDFANDGSKALEKFEKIFTIL